MKPCFAAVLVVISLLFNEAQGIRLSFVGQHHEIVSMQEERSSGNSLIRTSDGVGEDCKSKTGSVDRKLISTSTATATFSTTTSKNEGNPTTSTLQAENFRTNVDLADIAEMDYSPARRKPPIHN